MTTVATYLSISALSKHSIHSSTVLWSEFLDFVQEFMTLGISSKYGHIHQTKGGGGGGGGHPRRGRGAPCHVLLPFSRAVSRELEASPFCARKVV